jgi:hypothetical protein
MSEYYPAKNVFTFQSMYPPSHRCSTFGDLCSSDGDCYQSCTMGTNAGSTARARMGCMGTPYERVRNMGKCYAVNAELGDACAVGGGPLPPEPVTGNTCGPSLYCQQTLDVDSRPNSAPSFAAPDVGQGYCMPPPRASRLYMRAYTNML